MNIQDRLLVIEQTANAGVDTQGAARILELMGASALSTTSDKGQCIHIRQTTDPEPFHYAIRRALGLPPKPCELSV